MVSVVIKNKSLVKGKVIGTGVIGSIPRLVKSDTVANGFPPPRCFLGAVLPRR